MNKLDANHKSYDLAKIILTGDIVLVDTFLANGIAYVTDNGVRFAFDGEYETIKKEYDEKKCKVVNKKENQYLITAEELIDIIQMIANGWDSFSLTANDERMEICLRSQNGRDYFDGRYKIGSK